MSEFKIRLKEYKDVKERLEKLLQGKEIRDSDIKLGFKLINDRIVYLRDVKKTIETYAELFVTNEEAFIAKDKEREKNEIKLLEKIDELEAKQQVLESKIKENIVNPRSDQPRKRPRIMKIENIVHPIIIKKPKTVEEPKVENSLEKKFNRIKQEIPDCDIKQKHFDQLWENDDSINFLRNIWNPKSNKIKNSQVVRHKLPTYEIVTWNLS